MAINTYRLWMATDANRLLANQNAFIQASPPAFYLGNVAQLELHIVASAGVGTSPVEVPFPAGAAISVAVGDTSSYPTGGTWQLMVNTTETADLPYNATIAQVQAALNALSDVSNAGGVTVSKTGVGYTITWNTYGSKPSIGIGSDTLTPSSYESISLVQQGTVDYRQIVFVELRQNPVALGVDWTALPEPSVTVSQIQAWNGTNSIWRVSIDPQPKAGTITISYGSKTATLAYNTSVATIAAALSPAQVFATGQYQWDIVIDQNVTMTASGSLVGYNGFSGSLNFSTSECHQFLGGAERKSTVLEVSISVDSKRYTLLQTPCNVFADVISDGVLVPLPLGTAMSEQVANVRFVRRDVTQSPNGSTQDVIWQNLGVQTLGTDIVGAIDHSDSPSAANPFATLADINSSGATWGNIAGTLSDQTDLQIALNNKYDASNPAGFITSGDLSSFARLDGADFTGEVRFNQDPGNSGRLVIEGIVDPSGSGFSQARLHFGDTEPTQPNSGDVWFNMNYGLRYAGGSGGGTHTVASQDWATQNFYPRYSNPTGYLTASSLTGYATQSWVTSQNYLTSASLSGYATQTWVNGQGFITSSALTPYLTSANAATIYQTIANMSSYLTTTSAASTYLTQTNAASTYQTQSGMSSYLTTTNAASIYQTQAGMSAYATYLWVGQQGYLTSANLAGYAQLAGATFTGKVNLATISGTQSPSLNLGGQVDPNATNAVSGDLWISNAASPKISYKVGSTNYYCTTNNLTNTFTAPQVVDTTSNTLAALRITQKGTFPAIVVEDSTNPDTTAFVVDQNGAVGVGVDPSTFSPTNKVEVVGAIKTQTITFDGTAQFKINSVTTHGNGNDTHDLYISFNGSTYRIPMIFVSTP